MVSFVELRAKSAFSLLEGALRIKDLPKLCLAEAMPALGVTDTDNLFGSLQISDVLAEAGVQPIIGAALTIKLEEAKRRQQRGALPAPRLAVYARSEAGYQDLLVLASRARTEEGRSEPHLALKEMEPFCKDLIILTGGPGGPVDRLIAEGQLDLAAALLRQLADVAPGRLYVEVQRHGDEREARTEPILVNLAYDLRLPLVAANEPHFASPDMFEAHDCLLCVAGNTLVMETDRRRLTPEHYFKGAKAMQKVFADLPEALEASVEIAERVHFRPKKRKAILPRFATSDGRSEADELAIRARAGLDLRLQANRLYAERSAYDERLDFEMSVIGRMGFPGYFLIVSDFIGWAKERGIPVGPGRGSGAGSLVAWALKITDLDPIRFGLFFERFLNPERVSMPDFDIDFCPERRDEVMSYVRDKYGADRVAQIITFGKLQARAVLRDVGRALGMPYGQVDRLCKLVPQNPSNPVTLKEAMAIEPRLRDEAAKEEAVGKLLDIGTRLEGLYRHSSTHAAGVVIGDRPLVELIPLTRVPDTDMLVTQLDMKWVELAGLVKFDLLGLKTLTILQRTIEFLGARGVTVSLETIPLDDRATFELLGRADTAGVFQVEGAGMRDVLRKMRPDSIEDLIALVALYRPGPMDDIPRYIACKHGRETVDYVDERIAPILKETFGVIVYQEQVMQIAQVLAGYSLGEADLLRRAMGKKIKQEMDQQKERFLRGAHERGVPADRADHIFEMIAKFAGYGFNKSHSAPYALLAYWTAYFKTNHPTEFVAANMSLDISNTDKLAHLCQDAAAIGIKVEPPDINRSQADFSVADGAIRYGLAAIKSIGRQAMEAIVDERQRNGPFTDIFDFAGRIGPPIVNRRSLETLAKAGVFDSLSPNRAAIVASSETLIAHAGWAAQERALQQANLFGGEAAHSVRPRLANVPAQAPLDRLQSEAEAIGFYLSGHPLDDYRHVLRRARIATFGELKADSRRIARRVQLAGTVLRRQERRSQKSDQPFAFAEFTDPTGRFEAVIFSDLLKSARPLLEPGMSVVVTADAEWEGEDVKLKVSSVRSLESLASDMDEAVRIYLDTPEPLASLAKHLPEGGKGRVSVVVLDRLAREIEIELKGRFQLGPRIKGLLKSVVGVLAVEDA